MTEPLELPHKPRREEQLTVRIDDVDARGDGVAQIDTLVGPQRAPMRFDVHVHRTVPGDLVVAQVSRSRKRRVDCFAAEILEPSQMRNKPRCSHFPDTDDRPGCGGCSLQLLDYRHQLAVKERRLKSLLAKAKIDPGLVAPVASAGDGWFYRNKMEFTFAGAAEEFSLGMHPAGFKYEVIHHRECLLMSQFVSDFVPAATDWARQFDIAAYRADEGFWRTLTIREGKNTGERLIELVTSHLGTGTEHSPAEIAQQFAQWLAGAYGDAVTSVFWTEHRAVRGERTQLFEHHLAGRQTLREELNVGGRTLSFEIAPRAFFQTNTAGAELLYSMVIEDVAAGGKETALDLYCGTGTIALCLAGAVERVVGVELVEEAVENARENATANDVTNVEFHAGDVGDVLSQLRPQADVIVVDPPRAGLLPQAHQELSKIDAARLVYVSCNPEALARDLPQLCAAGWQIERLRPVDMFPQTAHVETVAALRRS